jgi:hypothetical protein
MTTVGAPTRQADAKGARMTEGPLPGCGTVGEAALQSALIQFSPFV